MQFAMQIASNRTVESYQLVYERVRKKPSDKHKEVRYMMT